METWWWVSLLEYLSLARSTTNRKYLCTHLRMPTKSMAKVPISAGLLGQPLVTQAWVQGVSKKNDRQWTAPLLCFRIPHPALRFILFLLFICRYKPPLFCMMKIFPFLPALYPHSTSFFYSWDRGRTLTKGNNTFVKNKHTDPTQILQWVCRFQLSWLDGTE